MTMTMRGHGGHPSSKFTNSTKMEGDADDAEGPVFGNDTGWVGKFWNWFWLRTSPSDLEHAEASVLKIVGEVGSSYNTKHVNIGKVLGDNDIHVWTFSSNELLDGIPIVLLHGLGSGLGLWAINLKALTESKSRPVYAIDIPGFGRSSRPNYSSIPEEAEEQFVQMIEAWRARMKLPTIILLGHSFGGYLSYSYGLRHPERLAHLILADPWGFKQPPNGLLEATHLPIHHRLIANVLKSLPLNPLWSIRVAGPLGPNALKVVRADLIRNFSEFLFDDAEDTIANYIYHCNVQNPTGETAFYYIMSMFGWAKRPMEDRLENLDSSVPLTLIYGAKSWVDHYPAEEILRRRPVVSYVDYHMLDAGHHVYAGQHDSFNEIILQACHRVVYLVNPQIE